LPIAPRSHPSTWARTPRQKRQAFSHGITPPPTVYVTDPQATGWGDTWNGAPVVRPPLYADAIYQAGELVATTGHVAQASLADADGYTTQMVMRVGSEITTNRWGPRVTLPDGIVTNGMGGLLLATNAAGAQYVRITGDGGGWNSALEIDGHLFLSKWGASRIRFPAGGFVSDGVFYSNGGEMGFKSWLSGAERWVIRSLNGNAYIDNGSLTVAGTNTAASFVTTGTVSAAGAIYQAGELVATTGHVAQAIAGKVDQDSGMATNLWLQGETIVSDSYTNLWWRNVYSNGWHWLVAYTNAPGGAQ
jgi:hypothetical protein